MEAYFDNSATTVVLPQVAELVNHIMTVDYGNPSSMHLKGVQAEKYIRQAREDIAKTLHCKDKEIIFTSGGTESNNMAIIGACMAAKRKGKHIITTSVEHASVKAVMEFLKGFDFEITYLPVDENGVVSAEDVKNAIREDTILVSVMMVNNEVGSVMPIMEIGKTIKSIDESIIFHVDCIQSYGKYSISPNKMNIDMLSVSGHKIHGPKGSGFIYIREKTKVRPIIYGGGQQKNMRSGTENVPGIAGLALASKLAYDNLDSHREKLISLKDYLIDRLKEIEDVRIHSKIGDDGAPHIVNAAFMGVRSEVLLHTLEDKQIYVSAGSACSSNGNKVSGVLTSMGLETNEIDSSIRFSFSPLNSKEEIDYAIEVLKEVLPMLRRFTRR